MTTRIFLVGFMGAGKSTVGSLLAAELDWHFVDLDAEIEKSEGTSVAEIFSTRGENWFRAAEAECLKTLSAPRQQIVSLGGGAYVNPQNRSIVESLGLSVYLEAPLAVLLERIGKTSDRPLAGDRARLERLFEERLASYRMARVTIETSGLTPEDVVAGILRVVEGL